jgi:hypothetical protein
MNPNKDSVANPLTPEQSKAQVVDSARDIVDTLRLQPVNATFYRSSCNDQHEAPFRGVVSIDFPKAATFEQSDAEVATMTQQLQGGGWAGDTDFKSHGTALKRTMSLPCSFRKTRALPTAASRSTANAEI